MSFFLSLEILSSLSFSFFSERLSNLIAKKLRRKKKCSSILLIAPFTSPTWTKQATVNLYIDCFLINSPLLFITQRPIKQEMSSVIKQCDKVKINKSVKSLLFKEEEKALLVLFHMVRVIISEWLFLVFFSPPLCSVSYLIIKLYLFHELLVIFTIKYYTIDFLVSRSEFKSLIIYNVVLLSL